MKLKILSDSDIENFWFTQSLDVWLRVLGTNIMQLNNLYQKHEEK